MPAISVDTFNAIIRDELAWADEMGMEAREIGDGTAVVALPFEAGMTRPGGTVSGPFMMALADAAMYAAVLSEIGAVKLAVTTSFNINFLHRPHPGDLLAEARTLKVGKRLAVIDATIHSAGHGDPVAHATGTYSIPPRDT